MEFHKYKQITKQNTEKKEKRASPVQRKDKKELVRASDPSEFKIKI